LLVILCLSCQLSKPLPALSQQAAPATTLSREEKEQFLLKAKIVRSRGLSEGITGSRRGTLSDGNFTHRAHIQTIDERKTVFQSAQGTEFNFIDSYKNNLAAYRLDELLDLGMVPVCVKRNFQGNPASFTWWVDNFLMTEKQRYSKKVKAPTPETWNKQIYCVRVFDELIYNTDRNLGNLVITKNWRIWMIDHTRAFRFHKTLKDPKNLVKCDRHFLAALRGLQKEPLEKVLGEYLSSPQIEALLARRDLIVAFFDKAVAEKGEQAVLYDYLPRPGPSTESLP
jgi:hypothetical protein